MFLSYFRRIRMQPKEVRDRHALVIASIFTGTIAAVWGFTQLSLDPKANQQVATEAEVPFSNLIDQIKAQWASVREALPEETGEALVVATTSEFTDSPTTLRLDEGNLEDLREVMTNTEEWSENGEGATSTLRESTYQEVQIVTTSAHGGASGTSELAPPRSW